MKELKEYIATIPNFPKEGIMFRDVMSTFQDADGLKLSIDTMQDMVKDWDFDVIMGPEARGFMFGMPMAYNLGKPFVPVRKAGKLPRKTIAKTYDLEYGTATIEIHADAVKPGQKVLIVDDLLATGGTLEAICSLVEELGATVAGIAVLIELDDLKGRDLLKAPVAAAVHYEGE